MKHARIKLVSSWNHCSQILTGFFMLQAAGKLDLEIVKDEDMMRKTGNLPAVLVEYEGCRIVYETADGYQNPEGMRLLLQETDLYFKRSFSPEKNKQLFPEALASGMRPLGMNYLVSCAGNPYNTVSISSLLMQLRGDKPRSYFTCDKFESVPTFREQQRILFMTRLWEDTENAEAINETRIQLIRALRAEYGDRFIGGIRSSKIANALAPDLVVSKRQSERARYLRILRECDICIGTVGLHDSIGWKTAEYVAAGKAIVNERLAYQVPGDFRTGVHYLEFQTVDECLAAVAELDRDPQKTYEMKQANYAYYQQYLRPDRLVENTLQQIDRA